MTTPNVPDLSALVPLKWKTWVGVVSGLLTVIVPYVIMVEDYLPKPWALGIGFVIAILGALGIYKAPYVPQDAVLAPKTQAVVEAAGQPVDEYHNPWL